MRSTSRHLSQCQKRQVTHNTGARVFFSHVSPTHWQRAPSWPPVAACVSSSVDLGFPARLDGQQQPHFIPWYTVAHGGDPRRVFHVPLGVQTFHTFPRPDAWPPVRAADLHGPPSNFAAVWYHPQRNHFSQDAHHADPGQHNGSVQGASTRSSSVATSSTRVMRTPRWARTSDRYGESALAKANKEDTERRDREATTDDLRDRKH